MGCRSCREKIHEWQGSNSNFLGAPRAAGSLRRAGRRTTGHGAGHERQVVASDGARAAKNADGGRKRTGFAGTSTDGVAAVMLQTVVDETARSVASSSSKYSTVGSGSDDELQQAVDIAANTDDDNTSSFVTIEDERNFKPLHFPGPTRGTYQNIFVWPSRRWRARTVLTFEQVPKLDIRRKVAGDGSKQRSRKQRGTSVVDWDLDVVRPAPIVLAKDKKKGKKKKGQRAKGAKGGRKKPKKGGKGKKGGKKGKKGRGKSKKRRTTKSSRKSKRGKSKKGKSKSDKSKGSKSKKRNKEENEQPHESKEERHEEPKKDSGSPPPKASEQPVKVRDVTTVAEYKQKLMPPAPEPKNVDVAPAEEEEGWSICDLFFTTEGGKVYLLPWLRFGGPDSYKKEAGPTVTEQSSGFTPWSSVTGDGPMTTERTVTTYGWGPTTEKQVTSYATGPVLERTVTTTKSETNTVDQTIMRPQFGEQPSDLSSSSLTSPGISFSSKVPDVSSSKVPPKDVSAAPKGTKKMTAIGPPPEGAKDLHIHKGSGVLKDPDSKPATEEGSSTSKPAMEGTSSSPDSAKADKPSGQTIEENSSTGATASSISSGSPQASQVTKTERTVSSGSNRPSVGSQAEPLTASRGTSPLPGTETTVTETTVSREYLNPAAPASEPPLQINVGEGRSGESTAAPSQDLNQYKQNLTGLDTGENKGHSTVINIHDVGRSHGSEAKPTEKVKSEVEDRKQKSKDHKKKNDKGKTKKGDKGDKKSRKKGGKGHQQKSKKGGKGDKKSKKKDKDKGNKKKKKRKKKSD